MVCAKTNEKVIIKRPNNILQLFFVFVFLSDAAMMFVCFCSLLFMASLCSDSIYFVLSHFILKTYSRDNNQFWLSVFLLSFCVFFASLTFKFDDFFRLLASSIRAI